MPGDSKRRRLNDPDRVYESGKSQYQQRFPARRRSARRVDTPKATEIAGKKSPSELKSKSVDRQTQDRLHTRARWEFQRAGYEGNSCISDESPLDEQHSGQDEGKDTTSQKTLTQWDGFFSPEAHIRLQTGGNEAISDKEQRASGSAKGHERQQTLTQMPDWLQIGDSEYSGSEEHDSASDSQQNESGDEPAAVSSRSQTAGPTEISSPRSKVGKARGRERSPHDIANSTETLQAHHVGLKTPPKRIRSLEIPSSQSPPEGPLSTQKTERYWSAEKPSYAVTPTKSKDLLKSEVFHGNFDQAGLTRIKELTSQDRPLRKGIGMSASKRSQQLYATEDRSALEDVASASALADSTMSYTSYVRAVTKIKTEPQDSEQIISAPPSISSQSQFDLDAITPRRVCWDRRVSSLDNSKRAGNAHDSSPSPGPSEASTLDVTQRSQHHSSTTEFSGPIPPPYALPSSSAGILPGDSPTFESFSRGSQHASSQRKIFSSQLRDLIPELADDYSLPPAPNWTQDEIDDEY
jgi:hypothetical protein